ncbi:MAG: AGE family epimerase/isomerase [Victivallales bacterium]|nr:AGE family epimerase/isomerase [Victivallales bacterium]
MSTSFLFITIACLLFGIHANAQETTHDWNKLADGMTGALVKNFWGASFKEHPDRYFFNKMSQQADMATNDYWPQAHAMDVIVDAYLRTHDDKYLAMFDQWFEGVPRFYNGRNGDRWWRAYVDDMEWVVLTQIRMYEASSRTVYLNKARQMYADWIWTQWCPEHQAPFHGGITWKTGGEPSKNACSNAPAAIIAAKLSRFADVDKEHDRKSREEYLAEAVRIVSWMQAHLYDANNGEIFDNMKNDGSIRKAAFTYNQGTFLGACHELFRLTGNIDYLTTAEKAAEFIIKHKTTNNGALSNSERGDGALFHGIFFRYLVKLALEPAVEAELREQYKDYLTRLAAILVDEGLNRETMLYGGKWHEAPPADKPSSLNAHVTGCMLLEAVCLLNQK